jgi:hypothetical protein
MPGRRMRQPNGIRCEMSLNVNTATVGANDVTARTTESTRRAISAVEAPDITSLPPPKSATRSGDNDEADGSCSTRIWSRRRPRTARLA